MKFVRICVALAVIILALQSCILFNLNYERKKRLSENMLFENDIPSYSESHESQPKTVEDVELVQNKPAGNQEIEPNDLPGDAMEIKPYQFISGSLASDKDIDWYKFIASGPREIRIALDHEKLLSDSSYWKYAVFDSKGVMIGSGRAAGDEKTHTSNQINLDKGTYLIAVLKADSYSNAQYVLSVSEKEL